MPDTRVDLTLLYLINYSARQPILQFVPSTDRRCSSLFLSLPLAQFFFILGRRLRSSRDHCRIALASSIFARVSSSRRRRRSIDPRFISSGSVSAQRASPRGSNVRAYIGIDIFFELELCTRRAKYAPPLYSDDVGLLYSLLYSEYLLTSASIVVYADFEDFIFQCSQVYCK